MVIPPKPWAAPNIGGHLSHQSLIMRVRGSTMQINQLFRQHREGGLSQVSPLILCCCYLSVQRHAPVPLTTYSCMALASGGTVYSKLLGLQSKKLVTRRLELYS